MHVKIDKSWQPALHQEFNSPYFKNLTDFVKTEYQTKTCFPPGNQIFSAFDHCQFEAVKVVIIGQDPYHSPGQANGLCFSVADGIPFPPSLINIFREIESDLGKPFPQSGNLERWADQGVLLLNTTLTVERGKAGSHQNHGWETFTDAVIREISAKRENVVFLLWGNYAKNKGASIDRTKHCVLTSGHPSPMSANRGLWFGNHHFSKANAYLKNHGLPEINW